MEFAPELLALYRASGLPPDQITEDDRQTLLELAAGRHLVFEVGTYLGASAEMMLVGQRGAGVVITLDTFGGSPEDWTSWHENKPPPDGAMQAIARGRLARFGDRCQIMQAPSPAVASIFADGIADLVFLDGEHHYTAILADIRAWLPKLKPGGLMAGHDYDKEADALMRGDPAEFERRSHYTFYEGLHYGVARAVNEIFATHELAPRKGSSIWWARPEWARFDNAD
jgi:predicted O-methyltransferase YrrM